MHRQTRKIAMVKFEMRQIDRSAVGTGGPKE